MNTITEVVSEYKAFVKGGKPPYEIKGRTLKNINGTGNNDYIWEVSHFYKPSETAGFYYPTIQNERTIESARNRLLTYLSGFRSDIGVERNDEY